MRRGQLGVIVLILVAVLLSGCAQQAKGPSIEILSIEPSGAKQGEMFNVTWRVDGPAGVTEHTAVHYGSVSYPGVLTVDVTPQETGYAKLTVPKSGDVPATFSEVLRADAAGFVFLRAHVILAGKHYWTSEYRVPVAPGTSSSDTKTVEEKGVEPAVQTVPPASSTVQEFVIEGDDNGLYPDTITVKQGEKVKITFKARKENVYYGGLDFRSSYFNTKSVPPGGEASVEFIAEKSFPFTSYWPASGVKKAGGQVVVV